VLGATIKETHIIITTTDWTEYVLTMLSFILNPVHFPRILLVFLELQKPGFVSCQSLPPCPPGLPLRRIQFVLILVFSDSAISHSDFILKFVYDNTVS
jgi:hypothetical protein